MDENSITPPLSPDNPYMIDMDLEDSDMMFAEDHHLPQQFPSTASQFPDNDNLDVPNPTYVNQHPFTCSREHKKSAQKQLEGFLQTMDCVFVPDLDVVTELFGYHFVTCQLEQQLDQLFLFLSQWISRIQNKNPSPGTEILVWRQDIINFYIFLKSYILRYSGDEGELPPLVDSLLNLVHGTLLYVDTPTQAHYDGMSRVESCEYHCFHLCLDVYWESLELLCLIDHKFKDVPYRRQLTRCRHDGGHQTMLTKLLELVFWELVTLSQHVYSKVPMKEALGVSPFSCPCVREMWVMCEHLLRHRNTRGSGELFWVYVHNILQTLQEDDVPQDADMEIDSDVYLYPVSFPAIKDQTGFCLWLLTNLATLQDNQPNTPSVQFGRDSDYHDVMAVLRKSLAKPELPEVDLRFYLQCCVRLGEHWEPHVALLLLCWDHFYRRLDNNFQLNISTLDGLGTLSKSSLGLLDQCRRHGSGQYKFKPQDTSFQLFLCLLGNHLHQLLESGSTQEWKQIKGRVYSKFHQRRMQELTENGLYNFTCLFLSLSLAADTVDVTGKLCDFYDMVDTSRLTPGKTRVVWMGMFATIHLCQQKNIDVAFLTDKLGCAFDNVCQDFSCDDLDPGRRHQLWRLIHFYTENLQEVFESTSKLGAAHGRLITGGFSSLLNRCRSNELGPVLSTIDAVISRVRDIRKSGGDQKSLADLYNVLWTSVFPTLKSLACSQTASSFLADTLAGLGLLSFDSKKEDFISMVNFVQGGNVNKSLCCRFWSHLLPVDGVMAALSHVVPNYQSYLIQAWISCVMFLPSASPQLTTMNRCMLTLPEVKEILSLAAITMTDKTDRTCLHFIKAIDIVYTKTTVWKDRIQLRDKAMTYFSTVLREVTPLLQSLKPTETLANVYAVLGYIVKCCSQLLFVQAKADCPLPNIINSVVVPHFLFNTDKPVSPVFLAVIRDHLHLFVRGLGRLDYKKAPYVQRRLKDIVSIYLPKFWTSSSSLSVGIASTVHPLVTSLKESFVRQPTVAALGFRQFILEAAQEKFLLSSQSALLPNHHLALLFLKEVLSRTVSKDVISRDTLTVLGSVLTVMLLSDIPSTQQCAQQTASQLLDASKVSTAVTTDDVSARLEAFVTSHMKGHLDRCIQVLDKVSKVGAVFVRKILPKLQHYIVEHESFRGVGSDSKLRQNYTNLSRNVGGTISTKPTEDR